MGRLGKKKNSQALPQKMNKKSNLNIGEDYRVNLNNSMNQFQHHNFKEALCLSQSPVSDYYKFCGVNNSSLKNADTSIDKFDEQQPFQYHNNTSGDFQSSQKNIAEWIQDDQDMASPSFTVAPSALIANKICSRPPSPLFDIELNVDQENTINLTVAKGEDYRVKLAEVC